MTRHRTRCSSSLAVAALVALVVVGGCHSQSDAAQAPGGGPASYRDAVPANWEYPLDAAAVTGQHGMVATDAPLATDVGADVLRQGGNAMDAAVATAFALAVVFPAAGNIGGGGFIVTQMAGSPPAALDFREWAPKAASRDMYIGPDGKPDGKSITGDLAAGVPGSVAGLWEAHHKFGSKPWATLLAPAIRLADSGFVVDSDFARGTHYDSARLSKFPASAALFLPHGHPLQPGQRWRNPQLAAVLRRIAAEGPAGFYSGPTAEAIVAEMRHGHGIITMADLAAYHPKWRDPIAFDYRGYHIISMPPPSSGGMTIALMAHMLGGRDMQALGWHSPAEVHVMTEVMRRAFAVRNHFLGDPDVIPIPTEHLLSQAFADSLAGSIRPDTETPSSAVSFPTGMSAEGQHTTHFSVVDGEGNAVALTTTINSGFGSASTVGGDGFLLNDEMDDFTSQPGTPNSEGLVMGDANAIAPGKRMLSSMTPTIVQGHDGKPMLVTGASGGGHIITTVFQIVSNVVDYGMPLDAAVNAPRIHHQHLPDTLLYERNGLLANTISAVEAMGQPVKGTGHLAIGASIERTPTGVEGMYDPRVEGKAAGN
jgi:gamma-glutamyltranspeptidase/glutathione hydrolase